MTRSSIIKISKILVISLSSLLVLFVLSLTTLHFVTPSRIAYPKLDHFHFRLQYVFRGQAEDFGSPRYQVDYIKDVCSGGLTESPIHFHDNKDQIVHLHWRGITGGDVLKFYGNNQIGGLDNIMGYKLDQTLSFPPKITQIPIHSVSLPKPSQSDKYYIYTGDKNQFQKKDIQDFTNKTLEEFLGKDSKLRKEFEEVEKLEKSKTSLNPLTIQAQAHSGQEHKTLSEAQQHDLDTQKTASEKKAIDQRNNQVGSNQSSSPSPTKTEEELKQINNLIGNIVIFVQESEPTSEQIKARFDNLTPLEPSVCGG